MKQNFASVSVVIPCYEARSTIARALDSVARQTILPAEVIIIDDASPDNGVRYLNALVREHANQLNINLIELPINMGVASARNAGWELATQPYIAFLDADDAWHPKKIEIQYAYMQGHPQVALTSHCITILKDNAPFETISKVNFSVKALSKLKFLTSNRIGPSSVMLRKDIPHRFKCGKRYSEDYLLWFTLVSEKHQLHNIALSLASAFKPFFGHSGLSGKLWLMEKGELDTFSQLYQSRYISFIEYAFCTIYSLLKYLRRILIVKLRY